MANLFARRKMKTRIRQRDWSKLLSVKIRRKQVGTVSAFFLFARTNLPSVKKAQVLFNIFQENVQTMYIYLEQN